MTSSVLTTTIMFLILPLLIILGLIPLTNFAFKSTHSATGAASNITDWANKTFGDPSIRSDYAINLSQRDILMAKVSVVCTWVLVILCILSWVGRAFKLWCLP